MEGSDPAWIESTRDFYRSRKIGQRSGYGNSPAVLVVDMARAFCDPEHPVGADMSETLEQIAVLLEAARRKDLLTVYTTIAYHESGADAGTWASKLPTLRLLKLGDPITEIHPRIAPLDRDHVIVKKFASAFFQTHLASLLHASGVDTLVVAGCSTSGCIRASVIDSVSYGFRTVVPAECVADRVPGPHLANLFDIDSKYADVVSVDEVLDYFSRLGAGFSSA
jgi:nicotinamidase-related amidase